MNKCYSLLFSNHYFIRKENNIVHSSKLYVNNKKRAAFVKPTIMTFLKRGVNQNKYGKRSNANVVENTFDRRREIRLLESRWYTKFLKPGAISPELVVLDIEVLRLIPELQESD